MTDELPAWFTRAVAAPFTEHSARVDGLDLHYVRWGRAGGSRPKPPVVLVHGGGAHAFWWGYIAPLLADEYDVLALDLTGHGDSGRRESYPREVWARDILALLEHAQLSSPPTLVGHSMGGFVCMVTAALHGERLAGAILVDAPVRPPHDLEPNAPPRKDAARGGWSFERIAPYPDLESVVRRFRPLPEQPTPYPFLIDYVARRSVRKDADGFTWKFDPRVFERASTSSLRDYFRGARCRLALIRGAESAVMPQDVAQYMVSVWDGAVPLVDIPEGHHHLMFDQPLALLVALRAFLSDWRCSTPRSG